MKATAQKRVTQRTPAYAGWRAWLAIASTAVIAAILSVYLAATYRPAWYHSASIDYAQLQADKAALVKLQDDISAALNGGREIHFELDEQQVNRWLAARAELWPDALELGGLQAPRVSVSAGTLHAGATVAWGPFRAVVAATCRVVVAEDQVQVQLNEARVGAIPIPHRWLAALIPRTATTDRAVVDVGSAGTIALRNDWTWPNGKRRCRVRDFQAVDHVANIVLEPMPAGQR